MSSGIEGGGPVPSLDEEERQMARKRNFGRRSVLKGAAGVAGAALAAGRSPASP